MAIKQAPKWFLDSTTVRALIIGILPSVKVLTSAFGWEWNSEVVNAVVDVVCFAAGAGSGIYLLVKRHEQGGGLSLTKEAPKVD